MIILPHLRISFSTFPVYNINKTVLYFFKTFSNGDKVFSYAGVLMLGGLLKSKRAIRFQIKLIEYYVGKLHETTGMSVFDLLVRINQPK